MGWDDRILRELAEERRNERAEKDEQFMACFPAGRELTAAEVADALGGKRRNARVVNGWLRRLVRLRKLTRRKARVHGAAGPARWVYKRPDPPPTE